MRRLSIIDVLGRQQPVFNEDNCICLVFNGEIDNYRDLRQRLDRFRTQSDTKTIAHLFSFSLGRVGRPV